MKDTDLFLEPSEGTLTLNSPAKRNSLLDTPSKLVGIIILLILLVAMVVYYKSGRKESVTVNQRQGEFINPSLTQIQPQPTSGTMEIVKGEWRGVTCLDGRMRTSAKILTDNVWWEVRLDKDDRRIMSLYPRHWKPGSHLEITNDFNIMEWRVKSDQKVDRAEIAWSISVN